MPDTSWLQIGIVVLSVGNFLQPVLRACTPYVLVVGILYIAFRLWRTDSDVFAEIFGYFVYVSVFAVSGVLEVAGALRSGAAISLSPSSDTALCLALSLYSCFRMRGLILGRFEEPETHRYYSIAFILGPTLLLAGANACTVLYQSQDLRFPLCGTTYPHILHQALVGSCALCEVAALVSTLYRWAMRRLRLDDSIRRRVRRHYGIVQSFPRDRSSSDILQEAKDWTDRVYYGKESCGCDGSGCYFCYRSAIASVSVSEEFPRM